MFEFMYKVINKVACNLYKLFHPYFWGKRTQIYGIPKIIEINKLKLGRDVSINGGCFFDFIGGGTVEDRVTLSRGVTILTSGLETVDYKEISKMKYRKHINKPVYIGEGTWIAANVTICPGSNIPERCIIAAGSVVVGNLNEADCLYGGIPARKIKTLIRNAENDKYDNS